MSLLLVAHQKEGGMLCKVVVMDEVEVDIFSTTGELRGTPHDAQCISQPGLCSLACQYTACTTYWTISIKLTGVVMRDPFYLFDISAAAKFFV
jgi:hypothetical protein